MDTNQNKIKSLQEIYYQYSAPEGSGDKGTAHSYIEHFYSKIFDSVRFNHLKFLEIGVSTGLSLEMWGEYFENSEITGIDINYLEYKPKNSRIKLFVGDSTKPDSTKQIASEFDIIIDDGSHLLQSQLRTFFIFFPLLKQGGLYIIEDIRNIDMYRSIFLNLYPDTEIYDFRQFKNRHDDVTALIYKK